MERRKFLQASALGGLVLTLLPASSLFAGSKSATASVELPAAIGHIRHGLLSPVNALPSGWPTWISSFQREVFFKNGIAPSADDLSCCLLEVDGTPVTVSYDGTHAWLTSDDHATQLAHGQTATSTNSHKLTLVRADAEAIELDVASGEQFFAVLHGTADVNNQAVYAGQAIQSDEDRFKISVSAGSVALLINQPNNK